MGGVVVLDLGRGVLVVLGGNPGTPPLCLDRKLPALSSRENVQIQDFEPPLLQSS